MSNEVQSGLWPATSRRCDRGRRGVGAVAALIAVRFQHAAFGRAKAAGAPVEADISKLNQVR